VVNFIDLLTKVLEGEDHVRPVIFFSWLQTQALGKPKPITSEYLPAGGQHCVWSELLRDSHVQPVSQSAIVCSWLSAPSVWPGSLFG
jgi:hypothetical protein